MNNLLTLVIGVLITIAISMLGLVLIPSWQFESLQPVSIGEGENAATYPVALNEQQARGKEVYQSLGCIYCHSQQVRAEGFGADIDRGWGQRRSVPRDYALQDRPLLGTMRTGPDLANIGFRQPGDDWHHLHLFNPQFTSAGSIMPPHRFLYTVTSQAPSADEVAYKAPTGFYGSATWIVPGDDAKALVAYLKSLNQPYKLEEVR